MKAVRSSPTVPRTIRFPSRLRERIVQDAERCGRSFDAQVVAILRRHYGEDVDIAPSPDFVLRLAQESFEGISLREQRAIVRKLREDE